MRTPKNTGRRQLAIWVEPPVHRAVKIVAAVQCVSASEFILGAVAALFRDEGKPLPPGLQTALERRDERLAKITLK